MIRCAGREDLPQLTALWGVCFGDSEEEIGAFWKLLSGKARVFCAREGKSVVSMACALPVQLVDAQGESHPAAYLYAVGTAPAYRRRGLSAQVLSFAEDDLRNTHFWCLPRRLCLNSIKNSATGPPSTAPGKKSPSPPVPARSAGSARRSISISGSCSCLRISSPAGRSFWPIRRSRTGCTALKPATGSSARSVPKPADSFG